MGAQDSLHIDITPKRIKSATFRWLFCDRLLGTSLKPWRKNYPDPTPMTEDLSRERKWAGKACIYAGNFLVALHGAALLFDPSVGAG